MLVYHLFMNHINILFMNHNNEPHINVSHSFIFPQTVSAQTPNSAFNLQIIVRCIGDRHIDGTCGALYKDPHDRLKSNSRLNYNP